VFLSIYEDYKIQVSISHTPEGTNTKRESLGEGVRSAINKVHEASVKSIALCTTDNPKSVSYGNFVSLLVEEIKELKG